jgi:hypothetical protein
LLFLRVLRALRGDNLYYFKVKFLKVRETGG